MILGYIDPGQGMLIWQAIVSAFVGLLFYMKKTRDFIAAGVRRLFGRGKTAGSPIVETAAKSADKKISSVPVKVEAEAR